MGSEVAMRAALLAVLALSAATAACDPAPEAELRNGAGQPITMRSVKVIHGLYESARPKDVIIKPGKAVRFFRWDSLTLSMGRCDLTYAVPYKTLPLHVGLVIPFEVRPDGLVYLRAREGEDEHYHAIGLDEQPAGWPLKPDAKGCQ